MLDKIIIIDFDDSFTYNIANVLFPFEKSIKVVGHADFFGSYLSLLLNSKKKHLLILGPGPGHPGDHQNYFEDISKLRHKGNIYLMGICLGHQILGMMDKKVIQRAHEQIHGQTVRVEVEKKRRQVQRYNSLAVFEGEEEMDVRYFERGISYQFHPESVGTKTPHVFFQKALEFIK